MSSIKMIRSRSSTDGMARLFSIASDGGDAADVSARGSANKERPFANAERGGFDESAIPPKLSLRCAEGKRAIDFVSGQRPDRDNRNLARRAAHDAAD